MLIDPLLPNANPVAHLKSDVGDGSSQCLKWTRDHTAVVIGHVKTDTALFRTTKSPRCGVNNIRVEGRPQHAPWRIAMIYFDEGEQLNHG